MLFLSEEDVGRALDTTAFVEASHDAFVSVAQGVGQVPTRLVVQCGDAGPTLFKPACIGTALGLKVVSVREANADKGLATVPSALMLMDYETGLPRALLGGTLLTAMRTAAGSAAAARVLAASDARRLVVFGAGAQARAHILCMHAVLPELDTVHIVNRTEARAQSLCDEVTELLPSGGARSMHVVLLSDAEAVRDAVREADVICTTTNASTPVLDGADVKPGCFVAAVGAFTPAMQEVDVELIRRASIVAVDSEHARSSCGDLLIPVEQGVIAPEDMPLVGNLLLLHKAGSKDRSSEDIIVFKSVGTAAQDIVTADRVVAAALSKGIGQTLKL